MFERTRAHRGGTATGLRRRASVLAVVFAVAFAPAVRASRPTPASTDVAPRAPWSTTYVWSTRTAVPSPPAPRGVDVVAARGPSAAAAAFGPVAADDDAVDVDAAVRASVVADRIARAVDAATVFHGYASSSAWLDAVAVAFGVVDPSLLAYVAARASRDDSIVTSRLG